MSIKEAIKRGLMQRKAASPDAPANQRMQHARQTAGTMPVSTSGVSTSGSCWLYCENCNRETWHIRSEEGDFETYRCSEPGCNYPHTARTR